MAINASKSDIFHLKEDMKDGFNKIEQNLIRHSEQVRETAKDLYNKHEECSKEKDIKIYQSETVCKAGIKENTRCINNLEIKQEGLSTRMKIIYGVISAIGIGVISFGIYILRSIIGG